MFVGSAVRWLVLSLLYFHAQRPIKKFCEHAWYILSGFFSQMVTTYIKKKKEWYVCKSWFEIIGGCILYTKWHKVNLKKSSIASLLFPRSVHQWALPLLGPQTLYLCSILTFRILPPHSGQFHGVCSFIRIPKICELLGVIKGLTPDECGHVQSMENNWMHPHRP